MPDPVLGKLVWDNNTLKVTYPTKKGTSQPTIFDLPHLSSSLNKTEENDGMEVHLEIVQGKPTKIRPIGKEFLPRPTPQHRGQQNNRNIAHHQQHQTKQGTQVQILPQKQSANSAPGDFHNPYNFVPTPPRKSKNPYLGDGEPKGHHLYEEHCFSGVIKIKMKVITPLLLPDNAKSQPLNTDHNSFPIRIDSNGTPYIQPTSIKGMIRSAFEAVTNSRFTVFNEWDRRLAYRRPARVEVQPARILEIGKDHLKIQILSKLWMRSPAKLHRYQQRPSNRNDKRKGEYEQALRYSDRSLPINGDHVHVKVNQSGKVLAIEKFGDVIANSDWLEGWVQINEPNINSKKYERVFVVSDQDRTISFQGQEALRIKTLWKDLIDDYQRNHAKDLEKRKKQGDLPTDYLGSEPGKTAWSRHIFDPCARDLIEGTLCYVKCSYNDKIDGIYPVSISRDLFPESPLKLLDQSLWPASELKELSPADRVFGWVNNKGNKGNGSYCGNVRFNQVICKTENSIENFGNPGLPLAILGQPMPQQSRFYVAQNPQGLAQPRNLSREESGYSEGKGLRGRKVYPHHSSLSLNYWTTNNNGQPNNQEYRRVGDTRDNQNRSIQSWVKPDSEFTFELQVTNLSRTEIGALLWLLSLPETSYHRFGGGKPLGFGSVHLSIDKTQLLDGKGWMEFYSDIINTQQSGFVNCKELIECFKKSSIDFFDEKVTFDEIPYIKAFLRMSTGHPDKLPTFYPRNQSQPNMDGEGFRWFTENEKSNQLSLPDLTSDSGLPYL